MYLKIKNIAIFNLFQQKLQNVFVTYILGIYNVVINLYSTFSKTKIKMF